MVQPCRHCGQMHESYVGCAPDALAGRPTLAGDDEVLVGSIVADRYVIGPVIGSGASGTVFAVEHVAFARPAAMKVLRPRMGSGDLLSRVFHGEARAAWSLSHACLVEVFDIGTLPDGAPFFVMERLEGETLATRIQRERLSIASTVDVMMQLLSALAAVHARDLLVRDLRPQNIFLAQRRGCRPLVKLLDFGLARLVPVDEVRVEWERQQNHPEPGQAEWARSIPYYLSPERARGEHATEAASDLFVAAAIMYEALTGERPFVGTTYDEIVQRITSGAHVPLVERRPELSAELSHFLTRTLAPDPRDRPADAKEMQDELRAVFEGGRKSTSALHSVSATSGIVNPVSSTYVDRTLESVPPRYGVAGPVSVTLTSSPPTAGVPETTRAASERPAPPSVGSRRAHDTAGARRLPKVNPEAVLGPDEMSTASQKIDLSILDEASAANADRTLPPPGYSGEPASAPVLERVEITEPQATARRGRGEEEDETETTELTPELRARVDELLASRDELPPTTAPSATPRTGKTR